MASRYTQYVLQRHEAVKAKTHYDFRMKYLHKSKLASWAIPKAKIPKNPGEKVLAIQTEDHPMSWYNFRGDIPQGSYGYGKVSIEQRGSLEVIGWGSDVISFRIQNGKYMNGKYALVKTKTTYGTDKKQQSWLLVKSKDDQED